MSFYMRTANRGRAVSATGCASRGNLSGRGRLLERRRKRRAGEGGDFIVVEAQPPASTRYVNAHAGTGRRPQGVPPEETRRGAVASRMFEGHEVGGRLTATAADGGVHASREQAQGVCWDMRGPHSR